MIFLVGSIVCSSYLTLAFKILKKYNINTLQSIVFNYITCVITGSIVNGSFPIHRSTLSTGWFSWAIIMGTSFFLTFNIIAFVAQQISVAVSSVANKLSLIIPFLFSVFLYNEHPGTIQITGIVIALGAVVFTCYQNKSSAAVQHHLSTLLIYGMPLILFICSGMLDTLLKYVEQQYLNENNSNDYLVSCFITASVFGLLTILIMIALRKMQFNPKAIIAGIAIGIPNYFSIWFLVKVLKNNPGNSATIIPTNNIGIVLFSTIMAWILFKERLSVVNKVGIVLACCAIALLSWSK